LNCVIKAAAKIVARNKCNQLEKNNPNNGIFVQNYFTAHADPTFLLNNFTRELEELLGFTFYFVVLVLVVRIDVSQIKAF
jgi:hypothetical protein